MSSTQWRRPVKPRPGGSLEIETAVPISILVRRDTTLMWEPAP